MCVRCRDEADIAIAGLQREDHGPGRNRHCDITEPSQRLT